jgi:16S rRNA (cytosine1407-C5)-methyltransferase
LVNHLETFQTPLEVDKIIQAFAKPRKTSFRINRLKHDGPTTKNRVIAEINQRLQEKKLKGRLSSLPWSENAFIFSDPDVKVYHLSDLECHQQGLIHFQSLSSILPPLCLAPGKGDQVLDMCAAPGGKTMQLIEAVVPEGNVVACDVDAERLTRLYRNADSLVPNDLRYLLDVRVGDSRKFSVWENEEDIRKMTELERSRIFKRQFDKILLDAPCSGEGIISLGTPTTYRHWSLKSVQKCARIQRQLLENAFHLLKPGGQLVYSTCTLSPQENEEQVQTFLDHHEGRMESIDLSIDFLGGQIRQSVPNFSPALTEYNGKSFHPEISRKALRVMPNDQYEGFFICKFQKI